MANPNPYFQGAVTVNPGTDLLQIKNPLGTVISWIDNTGTGQGNLSSSNIGPFAGDYYWYPPFEGNRSTGAFFPGSLAVAIMPLYINRSITFTRAQISISNVSTSPSVFYYFGIYDSNGNLLTFAKFPIGLGNPTGRIVQTLSTPITLPVGISRLCQGSDDTASSAQGQNYLYDTDLLNMIPGVGSSSNLISGGALPATLGTVSGPWPDSSPFIMLY